MPDPVIVIYGPTASGKSALALELADRLGGAIVNADALQLYAELQILTARPDADALSRAPHRLYGALRAAQAGSAAWWRTAALAEIADLRRTGLRPILVGGTGLYLTALIEGLSPVPEADLAARAEASALHERLGGEAFRAALAQFDPESAARLKSGDRQRLIRAWEVGASTGRPLSHWRTLPREPGHDLAFRLVGLMPPRDALYARIDRRFLDMMAAGALAEAARFEALGLPRTLPADKALGLAQLRDHLAGACPLEAAIARAQQLSRNYAKRQATWFRHQVPSMLGSRVEHRVVEELSESRLAEILAFIVQGR